MSTRPRAALSSAPAGHHAFTEVNPDGNASAVLVCDHGGNEVPADLHGLGLDPTELTRHIGYDIGAADVARCLAAALDAPAVIASFSRLVIDPNRDPDDPTAVPVISDGTIVPGNRGLDAAARAARVARYFRPYHDAVARRVAGVAARGRPPALISVHSFTPVMKGEARPWHVGVLWDEDGRIPLPLLAALRAERDLTVGDNEPYSGRKGQFGYTVPRHADAHGYPNVLLEIRQDLIDTPAGAEAWAALLARHLAPILADPATYRARG
ncbi:MAG: N-formylglutamate amidohydrolase [Alphaproteobacteria bacterium]|nr:N-formylglutamate amidohydrolase [Alphaproteobacteria bacterium]